MTNFQSLNDDILIAISSFLESRHARDFYLVSKRARWAAFKPALSSAGSWHPDQLRRLASYMLSFEPGWDAPRATFLNTLELHMDPSYPDTWSSSVDTSVTTSTELGSLIVDLLSVAQNLTTVTFKCFQPWLVLCPAIGTALASLSKLTSLSLSTIDDDTLPILSAMSSNIKDLTLSYTHENSNYPPDSTISLPPLLSALTSFRHLDTLTLRHFTPDFDEDVNSAFTLSLQSIQSLRLEEASIHALEIVQHLPRLSTLSFSLSEDAEAFQSVGPQWRPLRQLRVRYTLEMMYLAPRLSTVDVLQISGHEIFRGLPCKNDTVPLLAPLLPQANPLSIFLSLNYIPHSFALDIDSSPMWKEIASKSPRLRSFELNLRWGTYGHPNVNWGWILVRLSFSPIVVLPSDEKFYCRHTFPLRSPICMYLSSPSPSLPSTPLPSTTPSRSAVMMVE